MNKIRGKTTIFYSTHILDDVQRVSDIVAIMNHGELVAQAPIEELLCGKGNVPYNVLMKGGDVDAVRKKILLLPWVVDGKSGRAEWPHVHAGERDRRRESRGPACWKRSRPAASRSWSSGGKSWSWRTCT